MANDPAQIDWIKQHAVAFRSIDPADDDFSDLQPLKEIIGDSRIVQLGEQSHGDGTCFQTKIRLIRFLHEEMGFDVLAFESGLYDCRRAWQAFQADEDPLTAARLGVFGIWTGSRQTAPLWEYLGRQARGDTPLELAGFDCQFTGEASRQYLAGDLQQLRQRLGLADLEPADETAFVARLEQLVAGQRPDGPGEPLLHVLEQLAGAVDSADRSRLAAEEAGFWSQQLSSMRDHCARQWAPVLTDMPLAMARDRQMADNLIWLANERHAGRKIIVWAASFHILRNPAGIQVPDGSVDYRNTIQMGQRLHAELGGQLFTVGFTAARGQAEAFFRSAFDIGTAPAGTLESICTAAGLENGMVPLRNRPAGGAWLGQFLYARPLGYSWMRARWPDHFDAMVFNRTMVPSRR